MYVVPLVVEVASFDFPSFSHDEALFIKQHSFVYIIHHADDITCARSVCRRINMVVKFLKECILRHVICTEEKYLNMNIDYASNGNMTLV